VGAFIGCIIAFVFASPAPVESGFEHGSPGIGMFLLGQQLYLAAIGALLGMVLGAIVGVVLATWSAGPGEGAAPR